MKKTAYIVAEYDPFHNGHFHHVSKTREAGADTIVCVMSGNFTQRGEIAMLDKGARAEAAVRCGVDLVLELPLPFVVSGASAFAEGAAQVIAACGEPGTLSFGAAAPVEAIERLSDEMGVPALQDAARTIAAQTGAAYPAALRIALERRSGPALAQVLDDPNAVLACEYIKAVRARSLPVDFFAVQRYGAPHNAQLPENGYASAKYLRGALQKGEPDAGLGICAAFMPRASLDVLRRETEGGRAPARRDVFSAVAMSRLIGMTAQDFTGINGVNQGLENRLVKCIAENNDLYALFDAVKTKRFTHARIRQLLISAVLGVKRTDLRQPIPYVRVLGASAVGKVFLRRVQKDAPVPFVTNLSDAPVGRMREADAQAAKLYEFCRPVPAAGNPEYRIKPFLLP